MYLLPHQFDRSLQSNEREETDGSSLRLSDLRAVDIMNANIVFLGDALLMYVFRAGIDRSGKCYVKFEDRAKSGMR